MLSKETRLKIKLNRAEARNKRLKKILYSYRVQYTAAMQATSLGLCKRVIKHAFQDEQRMKRKKVK